MFGAQMLGCLTDATAVTVTETHGRASHNRATGRRRTAHGLAAGRDRTAVRVRGHDRVGGAARRLPPCRSGAALFRSAVADGTESGGLGDAGVRGADRAG